MDDTAVDVCCRIETLAELGADPPALRVTWIAWDSGFRGGGLAVGDHIIAVDGQPLAPPSEQRELQKWLSTAPGQYAENQRWQAVGAREGQTVSLRVRRRDRASGRGWLTLEVTASLLPLQRWTVNADGRRLLGSGGPEEYASDGYPESWSNWYDSRLGKPLRFLLDEVWRQRSLGSRYELKSLLEQQPRIDDLVRLYPGAFADAAKADFERAVTILDGQPVALDEHALDYRRADEERAAHAAEAGTQAWQRWLAAQTAATIPAFPAEHPVRGQPAAVIGKLVVLPVLGNSEWIAEAGHGWFVAGNASDNWYFIDAEGEAAQAMLLAMRRYTKLVATNLPARWQFAGRIAPEPRLLVIDQRAYFGLQVEPLAVLVGDAMFVDLAARSGTQVAFEGEAESARPQHPPPPDDAPPEVVMQAWIAALKSGDLALWKSLYASWSLFVDERGRLVVHPWAEYDCERLWEDARRRIMERVYDLRVAWIDEVRALTRGDRYEGEPRFDEVELELDHIGRFDGADGQPEYRVFKDVTVNRIWTLQRRDGGPWRISSVNGI